MSEAERVKRIIDDATKGDSVANKLVFDPHSKRIRPSDSVRNPDAGLSITNRETKFAAWM